MRAAKSQQTGGAVFGSRIIRSLQNPAYRIYFLATLSFFASMTMGQVANPKLIYYLTDSSALLGTMSLIASVPLLFMSLFGGAIADRLQKKWIIFACLLCFTVTTMGVALALESGVLSRERSGSWWILLVSSFIQGNLMGLFIPAFSSLIPEIIKKEQLMNAASLNTLGMNVLSLVAPAMAGLLIDNLDYRFVYYTMSGLYACATTLVLFIRHTSRMNARGGKILADIRNGFKYVRQNPQIWSLLAFTSAMVVLAMPFQQLLPIFTDKILKVGATGMGLLMSVSGGGALVGSIILAALPNKRRGLLLLAAGLIGGLALAGFAFSSAWAFSLSVMVFFGLSITFRNTIGNALLQTYTEAQYMGRVMSLMNMQWGIMALCTFFAGVAAEVVPVQWVVGTLATALIIVSAIAFSAGPRIRNLD